MDNKGINGRGLAHVMNRARSEFAQKKCVTEVVSELNGQYNSTGVVAKPLNATGFEWQKTADTLYSVDDFVGKTAIRQMHNDIIDKTDIVYDNISIASENGSFFMNTYFVCVYPEDVGKVLNVGTEAIFPEEGTYVWRSTSDWAYCTINIVGTYKRKFESSDQTCEVSCSIDPETLQVVYFDYTFDGIIKAMNLGQFIRLRCWLPDKTDDKIGTQLYASLESYSTDFGFFEFGGIIAADLGDGKQLYHYKVTLSEDNEISTEYKTLSCDGSDEQDNHLNMFLWLSWNSLRADFPTKDFADSWAYLSFQDIYDAVEGREKHVVIRIGWYDEDDDGCYRGVYTSNIAVEANFTNVSRYKQIIISAILNIDVRDGSGKQDYYFKFILNEDETVTTEYTRVGGSSDSEAVQEIFYADFDIDLSDFSVTGIRTTYQEIVSQIKAGKYIVGRGIYAMVSSPINIAYFPLSVDLREGDTLIFSGLIQSSYAGKAVILSITLSIDLSNEVYVKVRLVSTTDIV